MAIDYQALFGVEEYDPCAALVALRPAYMQLMAGGRVEKVSFRDRETWFQRADLEEFGRLITRLESECAAKRGRPQGREAIRVGARRRIPGTDPSRI